MTTEFFTIFCFHNNPSLIPQWPRRYWIRSATHIEPVEETGLQHNFLVSFSTAPRPTLLRKADMVTISPSLKRAMVLSWLFRIHGGCGFFFSSTTDNVFMAIYSCLGLETNSNSGFINIYKYRAKRQVCYNNDNREKLLINILTTLKVMLGEQYRCNYSEK